jgi:hypothetical protein
MLRIWTLFWLLVVALVATFPVVNWQVLSASRPSGLPWTRTSRALSNAILRLL